MKQSMPCVLLIVLLTTFGCGKQIDSKGVEIRVRNVSMYDYADVVVNTSGGEQEYGSLPAGQESSYELFEFAYRYAFVELLIGGDTFTLQPFDYVGETLLDAGRYTYEIDADASTDRYGRLSLNWVDDH